MMLSSQFHKHNRELVYPGLGRTCVYTNVCTLRMYNVIVISICEPCLEVHTYVLTRPRVYTTQLLPQGCKVYFFRTYVCTHTSRLASLPGTRKTELIAWRRPCRRKAKKQGARREERREQGSTMTCGEEEMGWGTGG